MFLFASLHDTGKPITGQQCLDMGLANKVCAPQELLSVAQAWAEQLAQKSSFALLATKRCMQFAMVSNSLDDIIEHEAVWQQYCAGAADNMEGVASFWQKKEPSFVGPPPDAPSSLTRPRL